MNPIQNSFGRPQKRGVDFIPSAYCTWNPYDKNGNVLLTNNYLTTSRNGGAGVVRGTIGKSSGKWYWEIVIDSFASAPDVFIGIANAACSLTANLGSTNDGYAIAVDGGDYYHNGFGGVASGSWPLPFS